MNVEYDIIHGSPATVQERLNKYAKDGWSVFSATGSGNNCFVLLYRSVQSSQDDSSSVIPTEPRTPEVIQSEINRARRHLAELEREMATVEKLQDAGIIPMLKSERG